MLLFRPNTFIHMFIGAVAMVVIAAGCSRSSKDYYNELKSAATYSEYEDVVTKYKKNPTPEKVRAAMAFYRDKASKQWPGRIARDLVLRGAARHPSELREDCMAFNDWVLRKETFYDSGNVHNDRLLRKGAWWYLVQIGHKVPEKTLLKAVEFECEHALEGERERFEGSVLQLTLKAVAILGSRHYPASTWWKEYVDPRTIPFPSVY